MRRARRLCAHSGRHGVNFNLIDYDLNNVCVDMGMALSIVELPGNVAGAVSCQNFRLQTKLP